MLGFLFYKVILFRDIAFATPPTQKGASAQWLAGTEGNVALCKSETGGRTSGRRTVGYLVRNGHISYLTCVDHFCWSMHV